MLNTATKGYSFMATKFLNVTNVLYYIITLLPHVMWSFARAKGHITCGNYITKPVQPCSASAQLDCWEGRYA